MNELSPAARAMVEAHRNSKVLTRAERGRIKQGVLIRVTALGAAGATAGTAVGMSLASKIGWVTLVFDDRGRGFRVGAARAHGKSEQHGSAFVCPNRP